MAASLAGGAKHTLPTTGPKLPSLTASEAQIAKQVLAKLNLQDGRSHAPGLASRAVADASVSGGVHTPLVGSIGHGQVHAGAGRDTFSGGVAKAGAIGGHAGIDRLLAGSAGFHGSTLQTARALADTASLRHTFHLTGDKLSVAGVTAAAFKADASHGAKTTTITLSDKTTVNVHGVSLHDITKGHFGSK